MNPRWLIVLFATVIALTLSAPVIASPAAQIGVDEVVIVSATTFTLTVRLDDVTTLAIPMQVDWHAAGPTEGSVDEVVVTSSPIVMRQGIFSVTVDAVEFSTGTLAVTMTQTADEVTPITSTASTTTTTTITATDGTTSTLVVTPTSTVTDTTTETVATANGPTTNQISNLRAGPSTDFAIVGSAAAGDPVDVVGQNADGSWLVLANGAWIAAFLVDNAPANLSVVTPTETPAAPATPAAAETPTAPETPTVVETPAAVAPTPTPSPTAGLPVPPSAIPTTTPAP